jgi:hypothetical protein
MSAHWTLIAILSLYDTKLVSRFSSHNLSLLKNHMKYFASEVKGRSVGLCPFR